MERYYIAMTYDVCDHNHLYENMNQYPLDTSISLEKQVEEYAKIDVAPIVKVFESDTNDFKDLRLYREYTFKQYECGC